MSRKKPPPPLPEGYIPPKPYADTCPRCKGPSRRNVFTYRDSPDGRVFGYFCEPCEQLPPWTK